MFLTFGRNTIFFMHSTYIADHQFKNIDFTATPLAYRDFEQCVFTDCNFNGVDLSDLNFINCLFVDCNLSLAQINSTSFQEVKFLNCKMTGFNLETCNPFGLKVHFDNCIINESSFYELQLQKTHFKGCNLQHSDFAYANLSQVFFENCNLDQTVFDQTNLEKANLSSAYNFTINPTQNKLKNAKFSKENCIGLLSSFQIKIE